MKVIGIACSPLARSSSLKAVEEFLRGAAEAGHETELIKLGDDLKGCTGCQGCKQENSGFCVQKDVLSRYFELLPEAGAVVVGAANYMGWPMGQAWTFMNRHYCVANGGGPERTFKIEAGKRLFTFFAQGNPDEEFYVKNYEVLCKPFENYGFKTEMPVVLTRVNAEEKLELAYAMGKELLTEAEPAEEPPAEEQKEEAPAE